MDLYGYDAGEGKKEAAFVDRFHFITRSQQPSLFFQHIAQAAQGADIDAAVF